MSTLGSSGSPTINGDGTCTIDSTGNDIVWAPATLISNSQCWVALRIETLFASTDDPYAGGDLRFFQFGTTDADHLHLVYAVGSDVWQARRAVAAANGDANSAGQSFAANTKFTLIAAFDASNSNVSVNGGAFTSAARAAGAIAATNFEIGNRSDGTRAGNSKFYWVAGGTGTLSDADAATLHAFGDTDPQWGDLPDNPTFLWPAIDLDYLEVVNPLPVVPAKMRAVR